MSQSTSTAYTDDLLGYGDNIFHHLPNAIAPSYQACLICYCVCAGVMGLEVLSNLDYDWAIARKSGWLSWSKCPNRVAYFVSRYASFGFLVMTIIYTVAPNLDCTTFAMANQIMWLCPLVCVDFIFLQRTVALFGWNKIVYTILYSFYLADLSLAICAVIWFGFGFRIPDSNFCAFFTSNSSQPHASLFIAYCVVLNILDTLILSLTMHRLVDGGLLAIPGKLMSNIRESFFKKESRNTTFSSVVSDKESISSLLMRQGLHYYAILELTRLAYLIVYYMNDNGNSTYQIVGSAILATVGPLLANRLFRETSEFIRARAVIRSNHNNTDAIINNLGGGTNMLTLPLISPVSIKLQPLYQSNKSSSSGGGDTIESRDYLGAASLYTGARQPRSKANTDKLEIHVSKNRTSPFVDDYEARGGVVRMPPSHSRILSYAEPPSPLPCHDTAPSRVSPPSHISRAAPNPQSWF